MKVSARTKSKPTPVEVEVNVPDDLDGQTKMYGKEVVAAHAKGSIVISLQAFMRRHISKGSTPQQIQEAVKAWKPDVRSAVKQSAFEKAASTIDKLSPQERAELLKKLQSGGAPKPQAVKSA
jgi:acyl-CoA reductase-like NAD-dependent aldehyde dehydrogenase